MTIDLDPILENLTNTYPCRLPQFTSLSSLLGPPSFPSPPSICLTGFPATGKSTITRAFLEAVKMNYVWIDCGEIITSALLFDRIVNRLKALGEGDGRLDRGKMMGGDVNSFVVEVQRVMEGLKGKVILVCAF